MYRYDCLTLRVDAIIPNLWINETKLESINHMFQATQKAGLGVKYRISGYDTHFLLIILVFQTLKTSFWLSRT